MNPRLLHVAALVAAFALGVGAALWYGRGDFQRWDREQRQPLLRQIAKQRADNARLLADTGRTVVVTLPPKRIHDTVTLAMPDSGAPAYVWRETVTRLRQDLATTREQRDTAERHWAEYGELARAQGVKIDSLRTALAASDSLLGASDTVLRNVPRVRPRWLTASGEIAAILGGGRVLAVDMAALPGRVQVIARGVRETGRADQVMVGVRIRL